MKKDKNLTTIYVVRHGETVWNIEGRLQGHTDSPLTEKGIEQAKEAGKLLKDVHFDAVFSSDSLRAKRTAEIISIEKKLAVQTTEALRERYFGRFEGSSWRDPQGEAKKLFDLYDNLTHEQKVSFSYEDIENDNQMMGRLFTFLREVAVAYAGKTILLVSHGGIMSALLIHLGFATYDEIPPPSIKNTSFIKIESDGVDFFVRETKGIGKQKDGNS